MARLKIRHLVPKPGRGGGMRYYWQPSAALREAGWTTVRLNDDLAKAVAEAEARNAELDAWRAGTATGPDERPAEAGPAHGSVAHLVALWRDDEAYRELKPNSKRVYDWAIDVVLEWTDAGREPARAVTGRVCKKLYSTLRRSHPHKANMVLTVMRLLFKFGLGEGLVSHNPATTVTMRGTEPRVAIWLWHQTTLFVDQADELGYPSVGDAVMLGRGLGQRLGDTLDRIWVARQDGSHRVRQTKTGTIVNVPEMPWLSRRLDQARARLDALGCTCPQIVVNEKTGDRYGLRVFQERFNLVRAAAAAREAKLIKAGELPAPNPELIGQLPIAELRFQDLRDTAATALAEASCSIPHICSITGHSLTSATNLLRHYLAMTDELAREAIAKAIAHEEERSRRAEG